jgi:hypothetical protein
VKEDIEVPGRGYDTKDVETMSRTVPPSGRSGRKAFVVLVLIVAVAAAVWMVAGR